MWPPGYVWQSGEQVREQFKSPSDAYFPQVTESIAQNLRNQSSKGEV